MALKLYTHEYIQFKKHCNDIVPPWLTYNGHILKESYYPIRQSFQNQFLELKSISRYFNQLTDKRQKRKDQLLPKFFFYYFSIMKQTVITVATISVMCELTKTDIALAKRKSRRSGAKIRTQNISQAILHPCHRVLYKQNRAPLSQSTLNQKTKGEGESSIKLSYCPRF